MTGGIYQELVLSGLIQFEAYDKREERVEMMNIFTENIFAIMQPKSYAQWKKKKDRDKQEHGVDEVIYKDEPENLDEVLREFGLG